MGIECPAADRVHDFSAPDWAHFTWLGRFSPGVNNGDQRIGLPSGQHLGPASVTFGAMIILGYPLIEWLNNLQNSI
jgi:hypothetical protein